MLFNFSQTSGHELTWMQMQHAILRNFGGLEGLDPLKVFDQKITNINKSLDVSTLLLQHAGWGITVSKQKQHLRVIILVSCQKIIM